MPRTGSAKRYAQAVFELALTKNELFTWQESLEKIAQLADKEEFMALLENPRLPFESKKELLRKTLGTVHPLALNLALLLVSKGRLKLARAILQQYLLLLDAHRGVERAKVIAATTLSDEDREIISSHLGKMVKRKVVVDAQVDPSIVGGFVARIGDRLIDGSIRQQLESLKKSLIEARW